MRVLFAVNNEKISEDIAKKYQLEYKEIISAKNVYYFNAIIKELQRNRNYDRIVISEDLEPYSNKNYEMIDRFLFERLDTISDEASNNADGDIPIILICTDRREKGEPLLTKLFSIGLYNALIGNDRNIGNVCSLINKPRSKRDAKSYYKIDADDAGYTPESGEEVNETEVQNILNHFKKLGKNENAFVTSFNDIAAQYTEGQLKLIVGYLPLNVRAVLEESCPAYQKLMMASVKGKIKEKKEKTITTTNINIPQRNGNNIDLINKALQKPRMSSPVVIPSSINTNNVKKMYQHPQTEDGVAIVKPTIVSGEIRKKTFSRPTIQTEQSVETNKPLNLEEDFQEEEILDSKDALLEMQEILNSEPTIETPAIEEIDTEEPIVSTEPVEIKKRGRGRPPKIKPVSDENQVEAGPKRGRGRPRKVLPQENPPEIPQESITDDSVNLFSLEDTDDIPSSQEDNSLNLFALDDETSHNHENQSSDDSVNLFDLEESEDEVNSSETFGKDNTNSSEDDINLFDLEEENEEQNETNSNQEDDDLNLFDLDGNEDQNDNEDETFLSGNQTSSEEDIDLFHMDTPEEKETPPVTQNSFQDSSRYDNNYASRKLMTTQDNYEENVLANYLTSDKKVVAFVGTSKNGTSFLVNNVAELLASKGINTAILDLTQNRNAYYIYTQNDENLRSQASHCIEGLRRGSANGISAGKNLTVYTTMPNEEDGIEDYTNILQTLVKNYSLVILDCDFQTNFNYFAQAQEIYLVQSYDILTIQPLTAFLRELEDKNVIQPNKLRVVVNKALKVRNLNDRMIIGGISKYNSPDMTYQKDLFDINTIMYTVIPFEDQTYAKYLEGLVTCNISLNGYSRGLLEALGILGDMIYPLISKNQYGGKNYNNYNANQSQFNSNIDSTLNKMRNSY